MHRRSAWLLLAWFLAPGHAWADAPREAIRVRLVHPDRQLERVLHLFKGTRSPSPAAALTAWKQAHPGSKGLGKPLEALIAAFNPAMVPELRSLHDASATYLVDPADGRLSWNATLPRDDGTFAALATALVLTDGGSDPPIGNLAIDRLGADGAPLMARQGQRVVLAGTRDDLVAALKATGNPPFDGPPIESGVVWRLVPARLRPAGSLPLRQLAEALLGLGCRAIEGTLAIERETISVEVRSDLAEDRKQPALDPAWLDWVPASNAVAAASMAIDARPEAWDAAFALADRVERADPARAGVAPLRTRLALIAAAARVQPEADLWPKLRGLTVVVLAGPDGEPDGAIVCLHAVDPAAATKLAAEVLPRLATSFLRTEPPRPGDEVRLLGRVSGRPLSIVRREATVAIGWGESALPSALDARDHPERSAGTLVRGPWGDRPPQRAGAAWPGRLNRFGPPGSPVVVALAKAPPVLWWGRDDRDNVRATSLRGLVHRFLEELALGR